MRFEKKISATKMAYIEIEGSMKWRESVENFMTI